MKSDKQTRTKQSSPSLPEQRVWRKVPDNNAAPGSFHLERVSAASESRLPSAPRKPRGRKHSLSPNKSVLFSARVKGRMTTIFGLGLGKLFIDQFRHVELPNNLDESAYCADATGRVLLVTLDEDDAFFTDGICRGGFRFKYLRAPLILSAKLGSNH